MKKEINNIIDNFRNLKVLVVGDAILDTYEFGNIDRICREAPVPVFNILSHKYSCGGAANTAINLAALGAETYYLTVVGKDANGKELLNILDSNNVHTEFIIKDKTRKTIAKKRVVASSNIILRIDEGTTENVSEAVENELKEKLFGLVEKTDAMLLSDYGFGVITDTLIKSLEGLNSASRPILVDSKNLNRFKKIHPTVVKPNYEETLKLLNISKVIKSKRGEQVIKQAGALLNCTGARSITVTMDASGAVLLQRGKKPYKIDCIPRDSKNTIGAGDTFISALTLATASQLAIETATEIAAAAAAVVVKKEGTVVCTNNELKSYFNAVPKLISTGDELDDIVKEVRVKHKKIVFTNGCFDLIHKGHIALLNQARDAGDVLIVGVNTDESVRKVKGPDRPINSLEDRIAVLAGLQSIDYLIAFAGETPHDLIKIVRPDVFVKGADYTETSIPEAPLLKKLGCLVKIIPCIHDISTTNIINKINDKSEDPNEKSAVDSARKITGSKSALLAG